MDASTEQEKDVILGNLVRAVQILESSEYFGLLMPEVRVNLVYSMENATSPKDVAGIDGRITLVSGRVKAAGYPKFGASDHMARLIIEVRKYDRRYRAGINFAWTPEISTFLEEYCKKMGWDYAGIDRSLEPKEFSSVEGMSMPWKIKTLVEMCGGKVPKIFYEGPGLGKEPLTVLLGKDAVEVATDVVEISRMYALKHK
ncbi:MAG: phosphomethylpyrimidine kinase [Thaumarchaeota archaeon]|jgi:hydroxymethylpyrimidine/phosphomethylpyrimidine kinase|nr:phosphomethylpyrimidine kinase [Candidatus Terraquivivens yellowstonensis]MCL7388230.1 phosphomethylpyrimidine kinase [Candidatus Terraquivivens yellowstonensis]MCL7392200.1 phosphomethylpyrimidine kinase [Candidatus Terraquivivens yellowstonensis]MCL7395544.1 phosphomethylpyrimidine kinase [Candidatus Terraquivivens yellowstonensis]MCL7397429.1 phosphomethylpyrimidine kinase [Candidatus Terraquivivens yellowstonensis]